MNQKHQRISIFFKLNNDRCLINNKHLSNITWVNEKVIANQYRNILSDYWKDKQNWWKKFKWIYKKWYHNADKLGEKLNMDEKHINNEYSTILSNPDKKLKNKICSILPWVWTKKNIRKLKKFFNKKQRDQVKEICVDMANWMIKVAREVFKKAIIVIDRYHVRNLVNEMTWAVKIRIKVKLSREETKRKKLAKQNKRKFKVKRYKNWETKLEMITRSHYQIRKNRKNWTPKEVNRWNIMRKISVFKALIAIYEQSMSLYDIYEKRINKTDATKLMKEWIKTNRRYSRVPEMLHLADSIERKLDYITNYFVSRHNNWYWEWLNSRIWKIVRDSRGFTNNDYMIFRLTTAL